MKPSSASASSTIQKLASPATMLALFALAISLRLDFLVIRGGLQSHQLDWAFKFYYGGISGTYVSMRDALLAGHVEPNLWVYMPGYPALLAIFDLLGFKDLRTVRVVQIVLDAAAIAPLFCLVKHLTRSDTLAVFAASIYAASPWWAQGAGYLLSESLAPALVICALAGMAWIREHPQYALGWAVLGLGCTILPFFRSEMILLAGPLILWAVMVGLPGRRQSSAMMVGLGFASPIIAWCLRNYLVHGQFALVPQVAWYNMWSGLGQVANDFGYFVDDQRAAELLQSKSIAWHTPDSEAFWKSEYLRAWREHPHHVLQTILFRMNYILSHCDYKYVPLRALCNVVYRWFAWGSLLAIIWLVWKRRWPEAFIIAGPMLYALASLGFIYVEPRYVRYAGLTYILGFPVFLALVSDAVSGGSKSLYPFPHLPLIKPGVGAAGVAAVVVYFASQQTRLQRTEYHGLISTSLDTANLEGAYRPDLTVQSLTFEPAIPTASAALGPLGLDVQATTGNQSYLVTAVLNANKVDAALVRYRVQLAEGGLTVGILSGDQQTFLNYQVVTGSPGSLHSSEFLTSVEPASRVVLSALHPTEQGSKFQIRDLEISFLCLQDPARFPLVYLFGQQLPRIGLCTRPDPSR
jgi:hypothetical protein